MSACSVETSFETFFPVENFISFAHQTCFNDKIEMLFLFPHTNDIPIMALKHRVGVTRTHGLADARINGCR